MSTALDLRKGERGFIIALATCNCSARLVEMGCYPGNEIKMKYKALFSGPVCIEINGSLLALRKEEASHIQIEKF